MEQDLPLIFAWSLARSYDKGEAEDLAQDIVLEVLRSVKRLEKDEAFWGFVWSIAENTLRTKLRKRKHQRADWREDLVQWESPEEVYLNLEEVQLLRRELALLSTQYREAAVLYYIEQKSCSEIAKELGISTEMVKYYLFKTRKILKEGIGMRREFGEKSYHPGKFQIDFWCENTQIYKELFKRRLPGNIMLTAYDRPVTLTELSIELGVASVYLEDELSILLSYDLLKKKGDRYQTNLIIFTEDYEQRVAGKLQRIAEETVHHLMESCEKVFDNFQKLDFYGSDQKENQMRWTLVNLILYQGMDQLQRQALDTNGSYPLLANGTRGFVFGYDNDGKYCKFNGIYDEIWDEKKEIQIVIVNYRQIEPCQLIRPGDLGLESDSSIHDFPVFSEQMLEQCRQKLLEEAIVVSCEGMRKMTEYAADVLQDQVPKNQRKASRQLA